MLLQQLQEQQRQQQHKQIKREQEKVVDPMLQAGGVDGVQLGEPVPTLGCFTTFGTHPDSREAD